LVVDHLGGCQRGSDVAAPHLEPPWVVNDRRSGIVEIEDRSGLYIADLDQPRGRGCLLMGLGDHDRDMLAVVLDTVVLKWVRGRGTERRHRPLGESWRVLVGEHGQDPRRSHHVTGVDPGDRAGGDA